MPNVLITGITGSGASYLAEHILEHYPEEKIWGISRWHSTSVLRNIAGIKDKITLRECDLNDMPSIIRVLQECQPTKIYHMAATANVHIAFITPLAVLQNNIMGTANLLEAIKLICPDTVIQICSTSEVFGTPSTFPILEDHPLNPSNPYAVSKLAAERLAWSYYKSWGMNVVITRAFAYANPRRHDLFGTAFALQIARIEAGKQEAVLHGNLNSIRTIMSIKDMSHAYCIASDKCDYGTPYNIGGTEPFAVGTFLDYLIAYAKCPIKKQQNPSLLRPSDITNQCPDTTLFYKKTGWKPKYSVEQCAEFLLTEARKVVANGYI